MSNSIASVQKYTATLDEVCQRASVSSCLNSGRCMVRAGCNAKETMVPKITVMGLGDYTRNKQPPAVPGPVPISLRGTLVG